jgi:hypothetical protein
MTGLQTRRIAFATIVAIVALTNIAVRGNGDYTSGFLLGGTAQHARDPQNPANDVIRINTLVEPFSGTVSRKLDTKLYLLDNMLEFKSYYRNRSCGGGSARIQLAIDLDGDGISDGNAFGHVKPPFAGCPPNVWDYDDVTDELPRWDISQFLDNGFPTPGAICTDPILALIPGLLATICPINTHSGYIPWNAFEAVVTKLFPYHTVCTGALVDDSGWMPAAAGVAYYDVISLGRKTWTNFGDTAGRGFAQGCGQVDHDDDQHDGDHDKDHDCDDEDHQYESDRHNRWNGSGDVLDGGLFKLFP